MKYSILILLVFSCVFSQIPTVGLLYHDSTQAFQGYTLFAPNTTTTTYLIDMNGNLVHSWESDYVPKLSAYLLEDGNLLRSAAIKHPTEQSQHRMGGFQLLDWESNIIWEYYNENQHHDIESLPNGNVLLILEDIKTADEAIQNGRNPSELSGSNVVSLSIIEVEQNGINSGEIVWRWNAWDHLVQDYDSSKPNFGTVSQHPELININYAAEGSLDWLHTNAIAYNEDLDHILLSHRNMHEIWIIDHSIHPDSTWAHVGGNNGKGGDLLYRWGNPASYKKGTKNDRILWGQHDAHWIEKGLPGDGNILLFNNGWDSLLYSTVDEIIPPINDTGNYDIGGGTFGPALPTWQYIANPPETFLSPRYGGVQRLPNGNTLICNSMDGDFIEVTTEGEIVWRYMNPVYTGGIFMQGDTTIGKNQSFRCYRYSPDYPAFSGKDLTAGNPIELYPTVNVEDENNYPNHFKLNENYPNPFNPITNIEFELTKSAMVNLVIYDLIGNKVRTLVNGYRESGLQSVTWDSRDDDGYPVSSGIYFYNIISGNQNQTKKMILLR